MQLQFLEKFSYYSCCRGHKRSDKPSKLTILVWRLVYFNGFFSYLHFIYVTIEMHLCPICNRHTTNVHYDDDDDDDELVT